MDSIYGKDYWRGTMTEKKKNESVYHYSLWFQFWQKWFLYWFLYSNIYNLSGLGAKKIKKLKEEEKRQFWDLIIIWRSVKFNFFTYIYYIWHVGSRKIVNIYSEISIQVSNTNRGSFISFVSNALGEIMNLSSSSHELNSEVEWIACIG